MTTLTDIDLSTRAPRFGGFSLTYVRLELKRRLRNRRGLFFTVAFPVLMYFLVGYQLRDQPLTNTPISQGGVSVAAYVMVSMAMYGAMMSATQTGASVAVERAQGWSRQLRLTPLNPAVNIIIKMIAGMAFGLAAVAVTFAVGSATGIVLTPVQWTTSGLTAWLLASAMFTTLGLLVGYLVPGENAPQITSLVVVMLSFLGGLFYPINSMPDVLQTVARFTPVYDISQLARAPITGDGLDLLWVWGALAWFAALLLITIWAFRRDTKRV